MRKEYYLLFVGMLLVTIGGALAGTLDDANGRFNITNQGAVIVSTPYGTGYSFNGTGAYMNWTPDEPLLNPFNTTSNASLEMWLKLNSLANQQILGMWTGGGDSAWKVEVSGSSVRLLVSDSASNTNTNCGTGGLYSFLKDQWYNIVFTHNVTECRMYINGVYINADTALNTHTRNSTGGLYIGMSAPTDTATFNGTLDRFIIYDHVLTNEEVRQRVWNYPAPTSNARWEFGDLTITPENLVYNHTNSTNHYFTFTNNTIVYQPHTITGIVTNGSGTWGELPDSNALSPASCPTGDWAISLGVQGTPSAVTKNILSKYINALTTQHEYSIQLAANGNVFWNVYNTTGDGNVGGANVFYDNNPGGETWSNTSVNVITIVGNQTEVKGCFNGLCKVNWITTGKGRGWANSNAPVSLGTASWSGSSNLTITDLKYVCGNVDSYFVKEEFENSPQNDARMVATFMIHKVVKGAVNLTSNNNILNNTFYDVIKVMYDNGWRTINTSQMIQIHNGDYTNIPDKPLYLVFDDCNSQEYYNAAPILAQFSFTGVAALMTGDKGTYATYGCEAGHAGDRMNWTEASLLRSQYGWDLVPHSVTHCSLSNEADSTYTNCSAIGRTYQDEIRISREMIINNTGQVEPGFVYPQNDYNSSIQAYATSLGLLVQPGNSGGVTTARFADIRAGITGFNRITIDNTTGIALQYARSFNTTLGTNTAWYHFDEGNGTVVHDIVAGNNGTFTGGWYDSGVTTTSTPYTEPLNIENLALARIFSSTRGLLVYGFTGTYGVDFNTTDTLLITQGAAPAYFPTCQAFGQGLGVFLTFMSIIVLVMIGGGLVLLLRKDVSTGVTYFQNMPGFAVALIVVCIVCVLGFMILMGMC